MPTPLKRQIGYKPGLASAIQAEKAPKKAKKTEKISSEVARKIDTTEITAKMVVAWINSHPGFKWGWMCEQVGLDRRNFVRVVHSENPSIKPEMVTKIVEVIKQYGFQVPQ